MPFFYPNDKKVYNTKKERRMLLSASFFFFSDSCRIQTCNLLIRSQMLYSVELRSHPLFQVFLYLKSGAKIHTFSECTKFFFYLFTKSDISD